MAIRGNKVNFDKVIKMVDDMVALLKKWCKTRTEELLALADTIKMLNDDDALELFKKILPGQYFRH